MLRWVDDAVAPALDAPDVFFWVAFFALAFVAFFWPAGFWPAGVLPVFVADVPDELFAGAFGADVRAAFFGVAFFSVTLRLASRWVARERGVGRTGSAASSSPPPTKDS